MAETTEPARPDLKMSDIVAQSNDAMQGIITRYRLAALPPRCS